MGWFDRSTCARLLVGMFSMGIVAQASLAAPNDRDFQTVRAGAGWVRIENGVEYPIDPEVVTVRFTRPIENLDGLRSRLESRFDGRELIDSLVTLRSNRLGFHDLRITDGSDVFDVLDALRATGLVESAEENTFGHYGAVPNDPRYNEQWALNNVGQTGGSSGADIDAPEAWDLQDGDPSIIVAVLDSGTERTHPDLNDNVWINGDEIAGNGSDDDGNGYVDDRFGWDFFNNNPQVEGPFSHGTIVAGCVAAESDNGIGVAGGGFVGGGALMMLEGVGDFSPSGSILDDAILYALDNGADIVTMSLTVGSSSAIDAAIEAAWAGGVFLDCAAGNGGGSVSYPARHPDVMAIAATDHDDLKAGFSNPGPEVEVAAPGVDILSTGLGSGYETSSGTSFSAPIVAGIAALLKSQNPGLTNAQIRQALIDTADDVEAPGFDTGTGFGRVNAAEALMLVGTGDPPLVNDLAPDTGLVTNTTSVTIEGENFVASPSVTFGGVPATFVTVIDANTLQAGVPAGEEMNTIDCEVTTLFGSDDIANAFTYVGRINQLDTPSLGSQIRYFGNGVPNGNWGVVIDYSAGSRLKKGLLFPIAFSSEWELVHDSFRTSDEALNSFGQGVARYTIPDDAAYIGRTIYAVGVFDGNGPNVGNELRLGVERVDTVIVP